MKKDKILFLISRFAAPVAMVLCGLVLLFSPDTASYLVAKLLSWVMQLWGVGCGLLAVFGSGSRMKNAFLAVALCVGGMWLAGNPLALAAGLGRFLGLALMVGALGGILQPGYSKSRIFYLVLEGLGVILTVLPLTASRVVFILCGLGLTAAGVVMFLSRLRQQRYLDGGDDDPNIIDAL